MLPTLRTDLTCEREEQQGVVFYRIDDPVAQTTARLYEIEYFIAQKFDGQRTQQDIIEAVKREHNFDINDSDLAKFLLQLQAMGLMVESDAPPPEGLPKLIQVQTQELILEPDVELDDDVEAVPLPAISPVGEVNHAEYARLLRCGLIHIRQGYLVHARDYLLAAKELVPNDDAVRQLLSALSTTPEKPTAEEAHLLWARIQTLFPHMVDQLGSIDMGSVSPAAQPVKPVAVAPQEATKSDAGRHRSLVVVGALAAALAVVGLWYAAKALHLLEGTVAVSTQPIVLRRAPIFFVGTAVGVRPVDEAWVSFGAEGDVGPSLAKVGARVHKDEILASLVFPATLNKQWTMAQAALQKAESEHARALESLNKVLPSSLDAQNERLSLEGKIRTLKSKPKGIANKKELATLSKDLLVLNKKILQLTRHLKGPQAAELRAKTKLHAVQLAADATDKQLSGKVLRAPFDGEVTEIRLAVGRRAVSGVPAIHLRDASSARLAFNVKDPGTLKADSAVFVSIHHGPPTPGKVLSVQQVRGGIEVVVDVLDSTGALCSMAPDSFRLLRTYVDNAFPVKPTAVLGSEKHAQIVLARDNLAVHQAVEVLQAEGSQVLVVGSGSAVAPNARVVAERLDGQDLALLPEGAALQSEASH